MTYTARFAHLRDMPKLKVGDVIRQDISIGVMGSSGASTAAHLHLDVIQGARSYHWRLSDYESGKACPIPSELARFLSKKLFRVYPVVTTAYNDNEYLIEYKKLHSAFDLVPEDRRETQAHYMMYWPIKESGVVTYAGHDNAYGNSVLIAYDA